MSQPVPQKRRPVPDKKQPAKQPANQSPIVPPNHPTKPPTQQPPPAPNLWLRFTVLTFVAVAILLVAPAFGSTKLDLIAALRSWFEGGEPTTGQYILLSTRLPRVAFAFVAGAGLALAGTVYQAVLRNDLAEPFSLGVAGGAAFGALLAFHLFDGYYTASQNALPIGAFCGATVAVGIILLLARFRSQQITPATLLLAGISLNFLFGAGILLLQYLNDPFQTVLILRWLMGGLDVYAWKIVAAASVTLVIVALLCQRYGNALDVLSLGNRTAFHLGVPVMRVQFLTLGSVSLLTALLVAYSGPIGFVGLIVPHALRRLISPRHALLIPACALGGGAFLVLCDTVARTLFAPTELPVGIITAFLGAPFFLGILLRSRSV